MFSTDRLSSMIFCTKKTPVVKMTPGEKVGNLSEGVGSDYVNHDALFIPPSPVENLCGQTCGECGKLCLPVCITPSERLERDVTSPGTTAHFLAEKREIVLILRHYDCQKKNLSFPLPEFLLKTNKNHSGIIFRQMEILSLSQNSTGGTPCREK